MARTALRGLQHRRGTDRLPSEEDDAALEVIARTYRLLQDLRRHAVGTSASPCLLRLSTGGRVPAWLCRGVGGGRGVACPVPAGGRGRDQGQEGEAAAGTTGAHKGRGCGCRTQGQVRLASPPSLPSSLCYMCRVHEDRRWIRHPLLPVHAIAIHARLF